MKTMSAREAKNGFGLMIDTARAEPVLIEKHGRGVVVVVSVEEYERLSVQSGRADKGEAGTRGGVERRPMKRPRVEINLVVERVVATGISDVE